MSSHFSLASRTFCQLASKGSHHKVITDTFMTIFPHRIKVCEGFSDVHLALRCIFWLITDHALSIQAQAVIAAGLQIVNPVWKLRRCAISLAFLSPCPILLAEASITEDPSQRLWSESCCYLNVYPHSVLSINSSHFSSNKCKLHVSFKSTSPLLSVKNICSDVPGANSHFLHLTYWAKLLLATPSQAPLDAILPPGSLGWCVSRLAPNERIQTFEFSQVW